MTELPRFPREALDLAVEAQLGTDCAIVALGCILVAVPLLAAAFFLTVFG
jgi:hypothetical protein